MGHPCLLQIFEKIEENDRKDYGFLSHDHEDLFEKGSTYKDKGLLENYLSSKSALKNNGNVSHSHISQQNQIFIDPKKATFLKGFYGGQKLDPEKVHPSLLRTLQKMEEEEGNDYHFYLSQAKIIFRNKFHM